MNGPAIREATQALQDVLDQNGIPLRLVTGADVHMAPNFIAGLRSGQLLSIADSRYVLVEPPHHTAPPQLEDFFFNLMIAGYVPVLTHPERLSWVPSRYETIKKLVRSGCLDADHRRLFHWRLRPECPILGREDAGRRVRPLGCV